MIGTGYVGLVTGACLADFGMDVVCVDKDADKIAALQRGEMPIYEPGLEEVVARNEKAGRLRFTTDLKTSIEEALAIFIAVGTPPKADGSPDLTFVRAVAAAIAEHMNGYKVVVTKSTVPTGTGRMIEQILREKNGRHEFSVVSNPSSCARAPPSPTSCGRTASSSARTTPARSGSSRRSTARCT
jgi:UDPglucose 6-dehydrogenase